MPAEEAPAADFAKGFEHLADLGLPSLEGAEWVKLPDSTGGMERFVDDYQFRQIGARLRGSGWRTPDGKHFDFGSATLVSGGSAEPAETAEDEEGALASIARKMLRNYQEQNSDDTPQPAPRPRTSLLETDAEALVEALSKGTVRKELAQNLEYRRPEVIGRILVFAAQAHAAGHPGPANETAAALFKISPDHTAIIDAAVSGLADQALAEATDSFFEDHDWKTYHQQLSELIERFPRGWDKGLAVAMLSNKVARRAEGREIPAPSFDDIPLDPEALEIIASWLDAPSDQNDTPDPDVDLSGVPAQYHAQVLASMGRTSAGFATRDLWLLPTDEEPGTGPAARITALGMDGLIALAAVATDETLTPFPRQDGGSRFRSSFSYGNPSAMDRARTHYQSMPRPLGRDEIAAQLLTPVIPGDFDDADPQTLRDAAVAFWNEHRESPPTELCRAYLAQGTDSQRQLASQHLAASPDPEAAGVLEKNVLEAADPLEMAQIVEIYLRERGPAAQPFFDKYSKQLRGHIGDTPIEDLGYSAGVYSIRQAGGLDPYLKTLAVLVGSSSLADLLADVTVDEPAPGAWESLAKSITSMPFAEVLAAFGEAMAEATPETRFQLLQTLLNRTARPAEIDEGRKLEQLPEDVAGHWRPLLENPEALPENDGRNADWFRHYGCTTIAESAALVIEFASNPDAQEQVHICHFIDHPEHPVGKLVLQRALALIDGEPLEPFPSADKVPEARREEIATLAAESDPLQLRTRVLDLNADERAAWAAGLQDFHGAAEPPPVLLAARHTITGSVPAENDDYPGRLPEFPDELGLKAGTSIDAEILERVAKDLLQQHPDLSGTIVQLARGPLDLGLDAVAWRPGPEAKSPWLAMLASRPEIAESDDQAFAMVSIDGGGRMAVWALGESGVEERTATDDGPASALTQYSDFLETNNLYLPTLIFAVLTREDLAEHQTDNE